MGVENKYDAYIATKQAIYSVLYNYDVDNVYRGVDERGKNIKKAIQKIVKIAREGTQTQKTALIQFHKVGKIVEDPVNSKYYSQTYRTSSDVSMKSYTITSIKNFTKNTMITDTKNKKKNTFSADEEFKVLIPKAELPQGTDINGTIHATMQCKTYPVFYGEKNSKLQPYALTYDTYGENIAQTALKAAMNTGKIEVHKVENQTKKPIEGVTFSLSKADGTKAGTVTTNKDGTAIFSNLYAGKYMLQEIKTNANYILNNTPFEVEVAYDKTHQIEVENELKKGQIKVIKVDAENKMIKIKDVEFEVLDENGNLLEMIKTDENGEAITKPYAIKDFKKLMLRENKTSNGYVLNDNLQTIILKENQMVEAIIANERIKGKVEIAKISANENRITKEEKGTLLKDAVFEIYSQKDKQLVDTITIGENGKGISKLLEQGKYDIVEKDSGSDYYLLNPKKYEIEITEHMQVVPITIENTSVDIGVDIEKDGVIKAKPNEEIKYEFKTLKNTSNVALNEFTWTDHLPHQYIRIEKLFTGTYNEDLDYVVKYKTNLSGDYKIYQMYNTKENHCVDFTKIKLKKGEYITDYKVEFGTVKPSFEAVEKPYIITKVRSTIKDGATWTNYTDLTGKYKEKKVEDKAEWTTKTEVKLPRTGF